jgi:hypothetical protein
MALLNIQFVCRLLIILSPLVQTAYASDESKDESVNVASANRPETTEFIACYDYTKPITAPLRRPFSNDSSALSHQIRPQMRKTKGHVTRGQWLVHWAAAQMNSQLSMAQVVSNMQDHKLSMSSSVDEYEVDESTDEHGQLQHVVRFLIKPFPFVNVRWTEKWTYALWRGTKNDPQVYHAAYQKIRGTSHIEHLCGSILAEQLPSGGTKITIIEEARATRTDADKTLQGVVGTIKSLGTYNALK